MSKSTQVVSSTPLDTALLEYMHTAVLLFNHDLSLRYMNLAAESLLQVSLQRCMHMPLDTLLNEQGERLDAFSKALSTNHRFFKRQTEITLIGQHSMTVDYAITPIGDQTPQWLIEIQPLDRSLRIIKEDILLSSQRMGRQMISGLAHEIKNPLGGIRGAAQLLQRDLQQKDLIEYTDIIINEVDRLRQLVDKLLGSDRALSLQPLNIHSAVNRIHKLIHAEMHPGLTIVTDYDPSLPNIVGDEDQLIQAILNISRNAVQAMANQPDALLTFRTRIHRKMTIGTQFHHLVVGLDIIDNGPGIKDEIKDTLFFPMITGHAEGTGLGLAIAQTIVNRHHGLIKVESLPGKTCFSIYIPLRENHD